MDYRTAELTPEAVQQLKQFEEELSKSTGDKIVLIAYKQDAIDSSGQNLQ